MWFIIWNKTLGVIEPAISTATTDKFAMGARLDYDTVFEN
jgi:hypothetical protein